MPLPNGHTEPMPQEEAETSAMSRNEKRVLIAGIGIPVLLAAAFFIWFFGIRDTWESDHRGDIVRLSEETVSLVRAKKSEASVRAYDELTRLIGNRKPKDVELQKSISEANAAIEPIKRALSESANLIRLMTLEEKAKSLASSGDVKRAVATYSEALDLIQKCDTGNPEFARAVQRISGPKSLLEEQLAKTQAEEAQRREAEQKLRDQETYNRQKEAKGYVKCRGKWITKEEYEQAKAIFPAKEIREGIEAYPHGSEGLYVVKGISIRKTDEVDFPYAIEITVSSSRRILLNNVPDQGVYTFHVDADLNLSDNYSIRGGEQEFEARTLTKCLVSVLSQVKGGR